MTDLVVAANRGPARVVVAEDGSTSAAAPAGGLAPSLARALAGTGATWVAAPATPDERRVARERGHVELEEGIVLELVDVAEEVQAAAYRVVANGTLWFLLHNLFDRVYRPAFDRRFGEAWDAYRTYNRAFAQRIAERAAPGALVVVHDYHLLLAGAYLAEQRPDLRTVHFSHTPFCTPEELALLPRAVAQELLAGLASYGAAGFHTPRWADAYRACARAFGLGETAPFVAPLGADRERLEALVASPACVAARDELLGRLGGRSLIVRVDRAEPSKNLVRGFLAFEELLERRPELRGRVQFHARAYLSRQELPEYLAYRANVEHLVERINERFTLPGGEPPVELATDDDLDRSLAALCCYDVLLVNPIRDGMNLVAKEGPLVNARSGVLALSREAGAFHELADGALAIDPFDVSGTASVLERALALEPAERTERAARLAEAAGAWPPSRWFAAVAAQARRAVRGPDRG
ncbi:MAG TPA: trehalose-6-phosphate synthase [Acidimicrobiales bacterium]|nr:trehalose-6-phosphate synthase [Acidimicrobiales bacterium]